MLLHEGQYEPNTEQVILQVSNKVLYVGDETAYPLSGLVRVRWGRYIPRTGQAIKRIFFTLIVFALLFPLANSLAVAYPSTSDARYVIVVGCIVMGWEPARILWRARRPYYMLSIDTAGGVGTLLGNPDRESMAKVGRMIVDAIDDPAADWKASIVNYHIGDNISQSGSGSIGKVTG